MATTKSFPASCFRVLLLSIDQQILAKAGVTAGSLLWLKVRGLVGFDVGRDLVDYAFGVDVGGQSIHVEGFVVMGDFQGFF